MTSMTDRHHARLFLSIPLLAIASLGLFACQEERPATPEAVITVAKQMVADDQAEKLYTLIYTESDREKRVWREVGSLLGHLQELAKAVNKAFPDEVASLRRQAEEAAENGQASSMIAGILTGQRQGRRGQGPNAARGSRTSRGPAAPTEQALTEAFASVMADPFSFLDEQEERLGSEFVAEDLYALTWDGKMLLPPLGILLKESEGNWYIMLPTNMPQIKDNIPDNEEFWQALPELVRVFDNMIVDLRDDVASGKMPNLASLSEHAGKKAFIPMMIAAYAIGKSTEGDEQDPPPQEDETEKPEEEPQGDG